MSPVVQRELKQTPNTSVSKRTIRVGRVRDMKGCCQCNLFFKCIVGKKREASLSQSD